jgi:hypothetical protein
MAGGSAQSHRSFAGATQLQDEHASRFGIAQLYADSGDKRLSIALKSKFGFPLLRQPNLAHQFGMPRIRPQRIQRIHRIPIASLTWI